MMVKSLLKSSLRSVITGFSLNRVLIVGLATLGAYVGVLHLEKRHLQESLATLALREDSVASVADSSHQIVGVLDSMTGLWAKRAVQAEIRADSLDKRLKDRPKVKTSATLSVDSAHAVVSAASADSLGVRSATFKLDTIPFHISVSVSIPAPPAAAIATISASVDTANVGVRLVCGSSKDGIASASVMFQTPSWLIVHILGVTQDPSICNPQISVGKQKSRGPWFIAGGVLGAVAGLYVGSHF